MVPDAVEVLRPPEVPRTAVETAEEVVRSADDWEAEVEVLRWYHDLPIWFVVEQHRAESLYQVLQVTAVREAGQLWFELATHREMRSEEMYHVPYDNSNGEVRVERFPIDTRADELVTAAHRLWSMEWPDTPTDPGSAPDWDHMPLPSSLRKPRS